jgi:hypothetical protein
MSGLTFQLQSGVQRDLVTIGPGKDLSLLVLRQEAVKFVNKQVSESFLLYISVLIKEK